MEAARVSSRHPPRVTWVCVDIVLCVYISYVSSLADALSLSFFLVGSNIVEPDHQINIGIDCVRGRVFYFIFGGVTCLLDWQHY